MTKLELTRALVTMHYPSRVWEKTPEGKFYSREATMLDLKRRAEWVQKKYQHYYEAIERGQETIL